MSHKQPYWYLLFPLCLLILACRLNEVVTINTPIPPNSPLSQSTTLAQPLPTADFSPTKSALGRSRQNPLPVGSKASLPDWEIEVLEISRGAQAQDAILRANPYNDPPLAGFEFVLVKLAIEKKALASQSAYLTLGLTGARQRLYYSFMQSSVPPEPRMPSDDEIEAGTTVEGWVDFIVWEGEEDLILVIEDGSDYMTPPWFIALDPDAHHEVSPLLSNIPVNDNGLTPKDPASFGDVVTTQDWQIELQQIITGEEAWTFLYETNSYNDPPPEGMMYVIVYAYIKYIGQDDADAYVVYDYDFLVLDDIGIEYDPPSIINPTPDLDLVRLYPGGDTEGWIVVQMPVNIVNPVLVFEPPNDYQGLQTRYLSLKQAGR